MLLHNIILKYSYVWIYPPRLGRRGRAAEAGQPGPGRLVRDAWSGLPGLSRRVRAAKAAAGEPEHRKECYQSFVNGDDRTCTIENVWEIKMCVFCGSGTLCPKHCAKFYFQGWTVHPWKWRRSVANLPRMFCPRTALSQEGPFCPKDVSLQNFWDEKSIGCSVRGRFIRAPV
jgi:hypothetical protein